MNDEKKGIHLVVNGMRYSGWKTACVTRGIESVSGSFELSISDRWQAGSDSWPIRQGDECKVTLDGETLITGYVDRRSVSYAAGEHSVSIAGRDRTGALVDCSAGVSPLSQKTVAELYGGSVPVGYREVFNFEYQRINLLELCKRVALHFGIEVSRGHGADTRETLNHVAIDPGETAFNVIDRLCKRAGVLPVSDGKGGLVLMRPGNARCSTELVEGENILAASAEFDSSQRYGRYIVLGQHSGSDTWFGAETSVRASAEDRGVRRDARVLIVRPEGSVSAAQAKRRAEWEATVRAARSASVFVTVQGWAQGDGTLWPVNAIVRVRSPHLGVDEDMLVSQADYEVGESGTTTRLTLRRPDSFKPEPTIRQTSAAWDEIAKGV